MWKALSEGRTAFVRLAVVADTDRPTPPCGACRQLLWEYCGDVEVVLANLERETGRHRLADLLPLPFDRVTAGFWGLGPGDWGIRPSHCRAA